MFRQRGIKLPDCKVLLAEDVPTIDELTGLGASVVAATGPQLLLDDTFLVSGEIPRVTEFEPGLPGQVRRTEDGSSWEPDELLMDERWLGVRVKDKGLVVLGGLHLAGFNEKIILLTIAAMRQFQLVTIGAGHRTGWRAMPALGAAFGDDIVAPSAVGKRYFFFSSASDACGHAVFLHRRFKIVFPTRRFAPAFTDPTPE